MCQLITTSLIFIKNIFISHIYSHTWFWYLTLSLSLCLTWILFIYLSFYLSISLSIKICVILVEILSCLEHVDRSVWDVAVVVGWCTCSSRASCTPWETNYINCVCLIASYTVSALVHCISSCTWRKCCLKFSQVCSSTGWLIQDVSPLLNACVFWKSKKAMLIFTVG